MGIMHKVFHYMNRIVFIFKQKKLVPVAFPVNCEKLLDGKIALVTGGNSGIGLAIAKAFQNAGANVIIAGRDKEKCKNAIKKMGGEQSILFVI